MTTPSTVDAPQILVVDDQEGVRLTLKGILSRKGYQVSVAEDGFQALEAVRKNKFKVVFMDIKMPGMNGVETFIKMKEISPDTTVIMMTAFTLENEVTQAVQEGAYAIINKPFDMERIWQILEECIGSRPVVMVVDDRMEDRKTIKGILEAKGFRVQEAESGEACLDMIQKQKFQIILMDVKMPGIDGVQTLKQIKKIRPDAGVIMMSGFSVEEMLQEAVQSGSFCTLRKPLEMETLITEIDRCLKNVPK